MHLPADILKSEEQAAEAARITTFTWFLVSTVFACEALTVYLISLWGQELDTELS